MTTLDFAQRYAKAGWCVQAIPLRAKHSTREGWQLRRLAYEELSREFRRRCNIIVNLGEPSGGLADIDIDCSEALQLAPEFLPATLTFGRAGRPRGHWLYRSPGAVTAFFKDPVAKKMLLELRATPAGAVGTDRGGHATVVPPSVHASGEFIAFGDDWKGLPLELEAAEMRKRVTALAVASLVSRYAGVDAARAFAKTGQLPELPALALGQVMDWLGLRKPAPLPEWKSYDSGSGWPQRVVNIHPAQIAVAFGYPAEREKGIGQCPVCGLDRRSDRDRRIAVGFTKAPSGAVIWHHNKCGSHGNSLQLASYLVLGKPKPASKDEWKRLREQLERAGVLA